MIDPDARVWGHNDIEYTLTLLPESATCREHLDRWCYRNLEGNWLITPTYIVCELESDILLLKLGYTPNAIL